MSVSTPQLPTPQLPVNARLPTSKTPKVRRRERPSPKIQLGFLLWAFRFFLPGCGRWELGVVWKLGFAVLGIVALSSSAPASDRYDPRLRFTTTRTAHFDIHAHQGEEALARRLAVIAERAWARLEPTLGRPRGRVHVILVDQTDLSNGWATPFPYNTIEITAAPPPLESLIGNTPDWLEVVFTHEYTHILHLDRSRGLMQGVRFVLGRNPIAFPNGFLPEWQVEGLATYEESRMTGQGRVPAGDFRAIVNTAAARGRFEPIDRASGGLTDWPSGHASYAYGAYFHQYLVDRFGEQRLSQLADATAGRVPLLGAGAFRKTFGTPVGQLWHEFARAREHAAPASSQTDARAARLTHQGFTVVSPRRGGDGALYYGVTNPDGFSSLLRLAPDGSTKRLAWRAGGSRVSIQGDWVVFDRVERVRSAALYSDLYAVRTDGAGLRRLTREARASDPDLSPDGRVVVCTLQSGGRRVLALVDFTASPAVPRVLVDDPESDFGGPRWSPDGRRIVAQRRHAGSYELVVIDASTREARTLISRPDTRLVTPSWSDDSTILFAAGPAGSPFNIFALDLTSGSIRQVTDSTSGAQFPELAADGTLIYVGYTPDGYDLFSGSTNPSTWSPTDLNPNANPNLNPNPNLNLNLNLNLNPNPNPNPNPNSRTSELQNFRTSEPSPYSPLRTLVPTYWSPLVESDAGETVVGAGTAMTDALGRHSYAASAGWSTRGRPDWQVSYAYDRWRPTFFASYADDTDPIRGGDLRSRELFAGALLRFRYVRFSETFLAGFDADTETAECGADCRGRAAARDFRSVRAGWLHDSRRQFGYSISDEEGFALEAALETSRTALGSNADTDTAVIDMRLFHRAVSRHTVVAARAAFAGSWGDLQARRVFSAAGAGPAYTAFDFGRDAIGLLRGFAPEDVVGTRAATASLDLRFPIARPQRGPVSWPILIHSFHGAAFVDAAHAWDRTFRAADIKSSIGGELSADVVLIHALRLTIASGAAWTRDPASPRSRAAFFVRIGRAF